MADVARVAGVSKTTVSLMLDNRETRLAEDTQRRVRSVAKQERG
ncbi:LacI family DNA-binding transcriptional regulator [Salsipaludibacter albus]|nr:LacI family DNA-binding transcriptional regulator [Salsipaludibacter albus]